MGLCSSIGAHASRLSWMWVLLLPLIGVTLLMTAYPVALIFLKSFALSRPGLPVTWGFQGWVDAFNDRSLLPVLTNTFSLAPSE